MLIVMYLVAIVLANLSIVAFGPSASILNAFLFIGLDLTARDALHEKWHGKYLVRNMALLIATGSVLSGLLNYNAIPIAIASFIAFAASATVDTVVYGLLEKRSRFVKVNGSNVFSGAVDSVVFPLLAFGWPPLWGIMLGEFVAKVLGGLVWSYILSKKAFRPATLV